MTAQTCPVESKLSEIRNFNQLGADYFFRQNFSASLYYFTQALDRIKNLRANKKSYSATKRVRCNVRTRQRPRTDFYAQSALEPITLNISLHDLRWDCMAAAIILHNAALVYGALGDLATAKKMLDFAIALIREDMDEFDLNELMQEQKGAVVIVSLYLTLANVMDKLSSHSLSDFKQVIRAFNVAAGLGRRYLRQHPLTSSAYLCMAQMLLQNGCVQEAASAFETASKIDNMFSFGVYAAEAGNLAAHAPAA